MKFSFKSRTSGQRLQPERRSGFRVITLKNAAWFALALVVLFLIFTAYMEHRADAGSDYGRLYDRRIEPTTTTTAPPPPPP